jgi:hypothetical protein
MLKIKRIYIVIFIKIKFKLNKMIINEKEYDYLFKYIIIGDSCIIKIKKQNKKFKLNHLS